MFAFVWTVVRIFFWAMSILYYSTVILQCTTSSSAQNCYSKREKYIRCVSSKYYVQSEQCFENSQKFSSDWFLKIVRISEVILVRLLSISTHCETTWDDPERKKSPENKKYSCSNICEYVNWLFLLGRIHNAVMSVNRNSDQCHAR